jgi:uncharacterized HAD superfamily protein
MKLQRLKKIYVDIDGTICENRDDLRQEDIDTPVNYSDVKPYPNRINVINELYDEGHTIVYWTARGCVSGDDYTEMTKDQLLRWGAKYHDLQVGNKPHFDMYICDKSFNSESFFLRKEKQLP